VGLGESAVENLTFAGALSLGEKTMAVFGESEQLARSHFLMRNGFHCDEALAHKILDIRPHAPFVSAVGELGEILTGNGTEFAKFHHRWGFRVPEAVSAPPYFMDRPGINGRSCVSIVVSCCYWGTVVGSLFAGHLVSRGRFARAFTPLGGVARSAEIFEFVAAGRFNRTPLQTKALAPRTHPCEAVCRDGRVFARCP